MAPVIRNEIEKKATGTTAKGIKASKLKKVLIPLPPLNEQKRIVAKVDELFSKCDQLKEKLQQAQNKSQILTQTSLAKLSVATDKKQFTKNWQFVTANFSLMIRTPQQVQELRQTILQLAVMGKLVPQDPNDEPASELLKKIHTEKQKLIAEKKIKKQKPLPPIIDKEKPYDLPDSWEWIRLGNLAKFIDYRGKTPNKTKSGIPLITAKNIKYGYLKETPKEYISKEEYNIWMTRGIPKYGDVVFTTEAPLGNVAQLLLKGKFALAQRAITFSLYVNSNRAFLKYVLMAPVIRNEIEKKATGTTAKGIKASKLKKVLIPLPPLKEQKRIVAKVDELFAKCDILEKQLTQSEQQRQKVCESILHFRK